MLSKNLVKQMYIVPPEEDTRVIDSNERVERRLKELVKASAKPDADGFVAGLNAERIEVRPEDQETEAGQSASLEQVSEEAQRILEQAAIDAQARISLTLIHL